MSGELAGWVLEFSRSVLAPATVGLASATLVAAASQALLLRRFRREQLERLRFGVFDRQLEAYQQLWSILSPVSYYRMDADSILVTSEGRPHLHVEHCRRFHLAVLDFFYSAHGLFLSKALRRELFDARDFVEELIAGRDPAADPEVLVPLTRKQRKEIEWRYDQVRLAIRNDLGLRDVESPTLAEGKRRRS